MKKLLISLIASILVIVSIAFGIYYDSHFIAPVSFKTSYVNLDTNGKLPKSFEGKKILFFSDLEYGDLFDQKHLAKLAKAINKLDYDIVIFGGDIIDKDFTPFSEDVTIITDFLKNINAPLGKFAVLGEMDILSDTKALLAKKLLSDGDFQIIEGSLKLYNGNTNGFIRLSEISSYDIKDEVKQDEPVVDPENDQEPIPVVPVYENVVNIIVTHNSKNYSSSLKDCSLVLAGHTHDSQLNILADTDYKIGLKGNLYVTSGVGLTEKNYRMFDRPELVIITLK